MQLLNDLITSPGAHGGEFQISNAYRLRMPVTSCMTLCQTGGTQVQVPEDTPLFVCMRTSDTSVGGSGLAGEKQTKKKNTTQK